MSLDHHQSRIEKSFRWVEIRCHQFLQLVKILYRDLHRHPTSDTPPPSINLIFCQYLTLLIATFLGGLFIANTFLDPIPKCYRPDFKSAQWIEVPDNPGTNGYFRKDFQVSPPLREAWIYVTAPDIYSLYINGKLIDSPIYVGKSVTGCYDIRSLLLPGKNVIAIHAERLISPGIAKVAVRGSWTDIQQRHEILSDNQWRASLLPLDQPGKLPWFSTSRSDLDWTKARPHGTPSILFDSTQTESTSPQVFEQPRKSLWIGSPNTSSSDLIFHGTFNNWIPFNRVWIRLAGGTTSGNPMPGPAARIATPSSASLTLPPVPTNTYYDLRVNGKLITDHRITGTQTDLAEIGRFVEFGKNEIEVRVRTDKGSPSLNLDGWSENPTGSVSYWKTDANWTVRSTGSTLERPVTLLGAYGVMPWGYDPIPYTTLPLASLPGDELNHLTLWTLSFIIAFVALAYSWYRTEKKLSVDPAWENRRSTIPSSMIVVHLPLIITLFSAWLLSFDARLSRDWCFSSWFFLIAIGAWIIPQKRLLNPNCFSLRYFPFPRFLTSPPSWLSRGVEPMPNRPQHWSWIIAGIAILGFTIRLTGLTNVALDHDEVQQINFSHSILRCGIPYWQAGSFTKFCSTYELLPYFLAASRLFFGISDFAYRLPSCLFGTATILLIGWITYRLRSPRAGILASLVYALFPASIGWAQNAFYPSQVQFFTLATVWFFYEAMRDAPFHRRLLILASFFLILTYFSWEASGFLLVALAAGFLALHGLRFFWIKDWNFWRALYLVCFIIVMQLAYRKMTMVKYLGIGTSLNDITTPSLVFLSRMDYDPWIYFRTCFLQENFAIPTILILLFPFYLRDRGLRYIAVVTFTMFLCYTNLLKVYSFRYTYLYQPLFIIIAVAWIDLLCEKLYRIGRLATTQLQSTTRWSIVLALLLFIFSTNGYFLKLYDASYTPATPSEKCRLGFYKIDYRGAAQFVKKHALPSDTVIAASSHVFKYYSGITPAYTINSLTSSRILYDANTGPPRYMDVFLGATVIRTIADLESIRAAGGRVWLVAAPYAVFLGSNSPDVIAFINQNSEIVYESYQIKVLLFPGTAPHGLAQQTSLK